MPVVFESPQPFAPRIAEDFGRTEQFNRSLPTLAGLYNSNQNRNAAAAQAYAENATRAQMASAQNRERAREADMESEDRFEFQRRQAEVTDRLQQQRFQQQAQLQAQDAYFQQAFAGVKVGLQEEMQQRNRERGLNEIQQMVADGTLDMTNPETASAVNDAIAELKTGINFTQRRAVAQQAAEREAHARQRDAEIARMQKAEVDADAFVADAARLGHTLKKFVDPNTGKTHILGFNRRTGELYNPFLNSGKTAGDGEEAGGQRAHLGTQGQYDVKKGLADAKAYAESVLGPRPKDALKGEVDVNKDARDKWDDLVRRRMEGTREGFDQSKGGKTGEGDEPSEKKSGPDQAYIEKIRSNPRTGIVEKDAAERSLGLLAQLRKKPQAELTPQDRQAIAQLLQTIDSALR